MARALVLEDNSEMRFILDQMLRSLDTDRVDPASTLHEARSALFSRDYDFALIDIGLKDENGLDLVREIRSDCGHRAHNMPIVVVSGQNSAAVVHAAREAGVDRFITKPLSIYTLSENLEKAMRARRAVAQSQVLASPENGESAGAVDSSDDDEFYV